MRAYCELLVQDLPPPRRVRDGRDGGVHPLAARPGGERGRAREGARGQGARGVAGVRRHLGRASRPRAGRDGGVRRRPRRPAEPDRPQARRRARDGGRTPRHRRDAGRRHRGGAAEQRLGRDPVPRRVAAGLRRRRDQQPDGGRGDGGDQPLADLAVAPSRPHQRRRREPDHRRGDGRPRRRATRTRARSSSRSRPSPTTSSSSRCRPTTVSPQSRSCSVGRRRSFDGRRGCRASSCSAAPRASASRRAQAVRRRGWDVVVASREPERADVPGEKAPLDVTDAAAVRAFFDALGADRPPRLDDRRTRGRPGEAARPRCGAARLRGEALGPAAGDPGGRRPRCRSCSLSGVAATTPMRGGAATAAVNGAVEALVRTLAVELAPVRVNAVSPGIIATPTWDAMAAEDREAMFERLSGSLPAGRVGTADDVAAGIWSLLTNEFVTGTVLPVDGGHRLAARLSGPGMTAGGRYSGPCRRGWASPSASRSRARVRRLAVCCRAPTVPPTTSTRACRRCSPRSSRRSSRGRGQPRRAADGDRVVRRRRRPAADRARAGRRRRSYCLQLEQGAELQHVVGPGGTPQPGRC